MKMYFAQCYCSPGGKNTAAEHLIQFSDSGKRSFSLVAQCKKFCQNRRLSTPVDDGNEKNRQQHCTWNVSLTNGKRVLDSIAHLKTNFAQKQGDDTAIGGK